MTNRLSYTGVTGPLNDMKHAEKGEKKLLQHKKMLKIGGLGISF